MSLDHPLFDFTTLERVQCAEVRQPGPIENGDNHGRGQIECRLLDSQHLPRVLAAGAVVLVLLRRRSRGRLITITLR